MTLTQLAKVLLVRACEENDSDQKFILRFERERAGNETTDSEEGSDSASPGSRGEAFLIKRAEQIAGRLTHDYPSLNSALHILHFHVPIKLLIACCLIGGFLADPIGPAGQINLLNFSLLTLLLWNGIIYAGLLLKWATPRNEGSRSETGLVEWLSGLSWRGPFNKFRFDPTANQEEAQWMTKSLASYSRHVVTNGRDLFRTHVRSSLHAAAAALAIGVIAGLYLRGFSFLYKAGWDSTFLEAEGVHSFLSILFAPASFFLQTPIPGVEAIAALRGAATANAAIWIHYWAITSFLFIVLPRTVLAITAFVRTKHLATDLHPPLSDAYFQRLLTPYRGKGLLVEVIPYSYRVKDAHDQLITFLSDAFGSRAHIHVGDSVQYGEFLPAFRSNKDGGICAVILFNVAQAPEETHSEFLEDLKSKIRQRGRPNMLLVLLDDEAYSQIDHEMRVAERVKAWTTLVKGSGLQVIELGQGSDGTDGKSLDIHDGLWPGDFRELQ